MTDAVTGAEPRIDFYILDLTGTDNRLNFACRLTEKAYKLGSRVYAHTLSKPLADRFDDMLWSFRQGSFVPHEVLGAGVPRAPVCIGTDAALLEAGEVLVNLAEEAPPFAQQFRRIAEIVTAEPDATAAGRRRFRHYRELGLSPETHRIGA
ncbi:MAG: DNA polymerase III subunit chi [Gammaproteobacteria bacterium]|jgi:DNA polymerase-3 subunit chi|nr:DNA polymerase III subunit chi [Gammaproteobacteria bacterium]